MTSRRPNPSRSPLWPARPARKIGTRPRRAAVAALVAPLLLAAGAAVAPAAISPERRLATLDSPRLLTTAARLAPDLRRLERRLAPASQTCGGNPAADGFGAPIVVVGAAYRSCDRFPFSASGAGPDRGPVLG
jgi:hypothetical protein